MSYHRVTSVASTSCVTFTNLPLPAHISFYCGGGGCCGGAISCPPPCPPRPLPLPRPLPPRPRLRSPALVSIRPCCCQFIGPPACARKLVTLNNIIPRTRPCYHTYLCPVGPHSRREDARRMRAACPGVAAEDAGRNEHTAYMHRLLHTLTCLYMPTFKINKHIAQASCLMLCNLTYRHRVRRIAVLRMLLQDAKCARQDQAKPRRENSRGGRMPEEQNKHTTYGYWLPGGGICVICERPICVKRTQ